MYFGYGSNLALADLAAWCERHGAQDARVRPLRRVWLPDHEVVFHYVSKARGGGTLSVRARRGGAVPGMLFETDEVGWRALDAKEGAPRRYERVERHALDETGDEVRAWTYVVTDAHREDAHVPPADEYLRLVCDALVSHGLPDRHVRAAAASLEAPSNVPSLFVYGTLMRGEPRSPIVGAHRPRSWRAASARGSLVDLGDYPGLVPGAGRVRGELVTFDDPARALEELDDVEEFLGYGAVGSLYRRVIVEARADEGRVEHAWAYRYVGPGDAPRIATGDWRAR